MQIDHKQIVDNGNTVIYIDVYIEDRYEFGKDNFKKSEANKCVKKKILDYVKENVKLIQGAIIVIAINGMVIGALSLDKVEQYTPKENEAEISNVITENTNEVEEDVKDTKITETSSQNTVKVENVKAENVKKENTTKNTTSNKTSTTTNNKKTDEQKEVPPNTNSLCYITLNTSGVIQKLELEEYIVGVVAAEMPASFNLEALKAQAVAARTYAMKKTTQGKVLANSTADQVYKTTAQMKSTWGNDYTYYYNRVKSAVQATKGLVIKYNGEYIDAQYSAMTNGKTELPEYVWSFSRPYLQCVSSSWDEKVKNFQVTKTFPYDKICNALEQNISKDTEIEVLSRTESGRVNKIKIGDKVYTGVEVRSKLGLRSTDFEIKFGDNVSITTKGYGHGVGMSQYGANVAANEGYTYTQILAHYYVGTTIESVY